MAIKKTMPITETKKIMPTKKQLLKPLPSRIARSVYKTSIDFLSSCVFIGVFLLLAKITCGFVRRYTQISGKLLF